ncbi:MAG: NAD(P)-dependent oxidoreductase [Propioniciclava sp.]
MPNPAPVGFLGLGPMGLPMAHALADAGFRVVAWNRTASKLDDLVARAGDAVLVAANPAEVARSARTVVAMLPDLPQVLEKLGGAHGLRAGWSAPAAGSADQDPPLLMIMSTVSPVAVAEAAAELSQDGIQIVDAPVSGGILGAEERRLSIMVGGSDAAVARVWPLLTVMGRTIEHLGPVGAGALTKACNQVVVAGSLVAIAEAVSLARAGGLDLAPVLRLLRSGLAGSELLNQKSDRFLTGDFAGGGSAKNQLKDLNFVLTAGDRLGIAQPLTEVTRALFTRLVEQGDGDLDHSAIIRMLDGPCMPDA